jgi:hypothetical protein
MNGKLISKRFPRASAYNPEWVLAGVSGAANPLWMAEWLSESLGLRPGMRVLDVGCGRALSSVILNREFGVQAWAAAGLRRNCRSRSRPFLHNMRRGRCCAARSSG